MDEERRDEGFPYLPAPSVEPYFGQPEDCADLVNKYGTYNIQPTADSENTFPMIAHGLGKKRRDMAVGKDELEK